MRVVCPVMVATLALISCRRDRPPPSAPPAPADAAVAPDAAGPADAAAPPRLGREPIEPGSAPPPDAPPRATVVGGSRFTDARGGGAVVLLEIASTDRRSVALQARVTDAAGELVRVVNDRADACPGDNLTSFAPPQVSVTDLDRDGTAELGFGYMVGCAGAAATVKQLVLVGAAKYIVRGSRPDAGVPEPAADAWPPGVLDFALAGFRDNAGALDVGAGRGAGDATIYDGDSPVERAVSRRTVGGVVIVADLPRLAMVSAAEATALAAQLRALLEPAPPYPPGTAGRHDGRCDLALLTPEVVSLACRILPPGADAAGPAPRRAGLTRWRTDDRAAVSLDELGVSKAARPAPASGCAWALTRAGVTWLAPDPLAPGCGPDLGWPALTPTSDRARRLVAAMASP
ncbi:MAG: hypothetical protein R3B06_31645 [Kofleriaceae bacterium]